MVKQYKMKRNLYQELKDRQQKEFNSFPIGFAFNDKQFKDQMERLGLTENDTDKIVSISAGGFIKKDDVKEFNNLMKKFGKEMKTEIDKDKDGSGFIKDMFLYELGNHEYIITGSLTDTFSALGLKIDDIIKSSKLKNGLELAKKEYFNEFNKNKNKSIDYER